jgi:predicted dehydrogenase/nucleoside-diphosphate-sugar epimerase
VGILGAGHISQFHLRAIQRVRNAEVIAICDLDRDRAETLATQFKVHGVDTSPQELLSRRLDVIHVLTPPMTHAENVLLALEHGCHVYVEKPLATSTDDVDRIALAAMRANRTVCAGHSALFDPFVRKALSLCEAGVIGDVISVDHFRSQEYPPYRGGPVPYQYKAGGFPFRDIGVHSVYLLEAFLGPTRDAHLALGPPSNDGCPLFKEWRVVLECERGLGHVYLSWNTRPLQDLLIIHGTHGTVRADIFGMSVTTRRVTPAPQHAERIFNSTKEGFGIAVQAISNVGRFLTGKIRRYHGLQSLVAEFYASLHSGAPAPVDVNQARNVIRVTEQLATRADDAKVAHLRLVHRGSAPLLITGATGFIGKHLLKRLQSTTNDRMRVFTRFAPPPEWRDDPQLEIVMGDLGDPEAVDEAVRGVSLVYHLGAAVKGSEEDFQRGTITGTRNIVTSILKHGSAKLLYMSSLSVLNMAAAQDGAVITNRWPLEPHPEERGSYSHAKFVAEDIVRSAIADRNLNAAIVRPGEVVPPDTPFLSDAAAIRLGRRLVMFGDGSGMIPITTMQDLLDAVVWLAEGGEFPSQPIHVVSETLSQAEIVRRYQIASKHDSPVVRVPMPLVMSLSWGADRALRLLEKKSPLTPYRLRSAIGKRQFDCSASNQFLNVGGASAALGRTIIDTEGMLAPRSGVSASVE